MKKSLIYVYYLIFLAIFIAIQLLLLKYMVNSGLEYKTQHIEGMSFSLPILILPALGGVVYMISCWDWLVKRHYQRYADSTFMGKSAAYRVIAKSSLLLFIYTLFNFIPLIFTSGSMVSALSSVTHILPQLENAANTVLQIVYPFVAFNMALKFATLQIISLTFVTLTAAIIGRK